MVSVEGEHGDATLLGVGSRVLSVVGNKCAWLSRHYSVLPGAGDHLRPPAFTWLFSDL